ncbi:unnamed protein product, partial [Closterium sp. NIES-53]
NVSNTNINGTIKGVSALTALALLFHIPPINPIPHPPYPPISPIPLPLGLPSPPSFNPLIPSSPHSSHSPGRDMSNNPIKDVAPLAPLTNLVYLNLEALGIKAAPNALGNLGLLKHL